MIVEGDNIWFRQSWVGTYLRCSERGRLAVTKPEYDEAEGDAALCGTAAHAGIEQVLNGHVEAGDIGKFTYGFAHARATDPDVTVNWQKFESPQELAGHSQRCAEAWVRDIYPHLPAPHVGLVEWNFRIPLFEHRGFTVGITGTADYIPTQLGDEPLPIYDWKTSGSKYRQHEKQKSDIQASIYSLAAVKEGHRQWPVEFNFGVMNRHKSEATADLIPVLRTEGHAAWVQRIITTAVDMYLDVGLNRPWQMRDADWLCSKKWCPWNAICRGCFIGSEDAFRGN